MTVRVEPVSLRVAATPAAPALLLRQWTDGDVESLIEAYRDPVQRRFSQFRVTDVDDARRWLELQWDGWESGKRFSFAVVDDSGAGAGRLVGNVALKAPDLASGSAGVGYWTAAAARGQGVASRALEVLTRWAFETFTADGLRCLELLHQVDNVASCRVAEKAGYRFDRVVPAHPPFPLDGHRHVRSAADRS
ncbi:GNAT family N-acetyltransferase [Plantactinospora sp. B5E13]|uniref:GNAT family N-acetyltransferase n=1 Tax=unclassified Plantactinospora TaxID=2631981 RepID=UPI00325D9080